MFQRFSYSALNDWHTCPRKFKFSKIEKVSVPKKISADAYLGSSVHRVLNKLYTLGADGIVLPFEEAVKIYEEDWAKVDREILSVVKDFYTVDDYIRLGKEMLETHYNSYKPFRADMLLGAELNLYAELPDSPFKFSAIIDRLSRLEDGTIQIADYKTGKRISKPTDLAFRLQMGLYQIAVKQHYPDYDSIELVQYFLRQNEVVKLRMTQDELDQLTYEVRNELYLIQDAEKRDDFQTQESGLCDYCDFFHLCPAKRHKLLLEEKDVGDEMAPEEKARNIAEKFITVDQKIKELTAEKNALRDEIIEIAKENNWTVLDADTGEVKIKIAYNEKFITKTDDLKMFSDLTILARELELDDYFRLDGASLMKEVYLKKILPEDALEKLQQFIILKDASRITTKLKK